MTPLQQKIRAEGLEPHRSYRFSFILSVPIYLARQLIRSFGIKGNSEAEFNSPFVNRLLSAVLALDIHAAPVLRPPSAFRSWRSAKR